VKDKTLSPLTHRGFRPAQAVGDLGVALSLRRPQDELGACDQGMRKSAGSGKTGSWACSSALKVRTDLGRPVSMDAAYLKNITYASYL
jgi:hypothetical protein